MKAVVIGGSGHIGTYLVPRLIKAGYVTVNVSRGQSKPYNLDDAWREVEAVVLDREKEAQGEFEKKIAAINADVVIDLINFTVEDTKRMVSALRDTRVSHYLFCSSIWAHGRATTLPMLEDQQKFPLDEYGEQKYRCEMYLHDLYRREGFPETVIMPGQISGPGWKIINPVGNLDLRVFDAIRRGDEIALPNFGMETLHHVHADDVAQVFMNCITHPNQALGESFHAVSTESITLYGYAQALYKWFGKEAKINLLPWDEWCKHMNNKELSDHSYYHIARSGTFSIEKAKRLVKYQPRYTVLEAIEVSIRSMIEKGFIKD